MSRGIVLVVEDDRSIRTGIVDALRYAGFEPLEAADGSEGLARAIEGTVDLVLLDVLLPKVNGFAVLEGIRKARPELPVIMVTAKGAEGDRVQGLEGGADDYVQKPFSIRELLARVEAVLRRSAERPTDVHSVRDARRFIDLHRCELRIGSDGALRTISLSAREVAIIRYLAANRGRAVDRGELLHRVWGLDPRGLETRTVDMQIARLRDKLRCDGETGDEFIATVRGRGYMLAAGIVTE